MEKGEKEFQDWLDSIELIKEDGSIVKPRLSKDDSPDPEGDRG